VSAPDDVGEDNFSLPGQVFFNSRRQSSTRCGNVSGSSAFAGANAYRSTVAIDPSRSFLIVRLRSAETHSTGANTAHDTVENTVVIHDTVACARSEPTDLDRTTDMGLNSEYCSYSTQIQRTHPYESRTMTRAVASG
jgi:hypothetical protein